MPVTEEQVEQQRKRTTRYATRYSDVAGAGDEFMNRVKEELRNRSAERGETEISKQIAGAREEFAEAPTQMREQYEAADPYARQRAIAARRAGLLSRLETLTGMREEREGTIQDIITEGARGIEAETERRRVLAEAEQQQYENLAEQQKWEAEFAEQKRQFEIEASIKREQMNTSGKTTETVLTPWGTFELTPSQALNYLTGVSDIESERDAVILEGESKISDVDRAIEIMTGQARGTDGFNRILSGDTSIRELQLKPYTGPIRKRVRGWFGGAFAGQEETEFRGLITSLSAERMFTVGGKALTATEKEELTPFLPRLEHDEQKTLNNLIEARKKIETQYNRKITELSPIYTIPPGAYGPPVPGGEWEIVE